ncbi:hypothetical protein [Flavobacterium sangjuense]|uniref:Uncharacterized protein n=1 Tax=Flavobacterium sangjuense TaxID=2518177 RepID=A0A4P7PSX7_9FLAO|nr:hypothetical protein [Flavobacterium sangjuense]QBZ97756.1 hypothetical protein GS03_01254 [Flavobacterium sangjuense]
MTELEHFQRLKQLVLLKYQEHYPFFQGSWKTFSAQDIQNLIGLIEEINRQTISEKWIYTHLKPEVNQKIPRKDMLNILTEFVGLSGWDEFVFEASSENEAISKTKKKLSKTWLLILLPVIAIAVWYFGFYSSAKPKTNTIELNNEFTNEKIKSDEVKVVQVEDTVERNLEVKDGKVNVKTSGDKETKLVIKSPFYRPRTITLNAANNGSVVPPPKITLTPDDYAMMLKAFMISDIKDWQTRKEQLNKILADDLEVIVMLKNNLGSEYYDKNEFSQKLIVPTATVKRMKIIEVKNDADDRIQFIRIKQE